MRPFLAELAVDPELKGIPILLVNEQSVLPDLQELGVRPDLITYVCKFFRKHYRILFPAEIIACGQRVGETKVQV